MYLRISKFVPILFASSTGFTILMDGTLHEGHFYSAGRLFMFGNGII